MKEQVLVTGGAGFIGTNLVRKLLKKGYEVFVIDDFSLGKWENKESEAIYFAGSVGNVVKIMKKMDINPEIIFHLGIPSSSPMYKNNRNNIILAVKDFVKLMEYCMSKNSKLVLASTSSVYNGNPLPWKEDMNIFPKDFYSEVRYFMERLASVYNQLYGVEAVACRLFSVYGPCEEHKGKYANLVSQFIWSIMRDEPPIIYGDGSQTRDFIYVEDVTECFIKTSKYTPEKFEVFNVGYGKNYSLNELVEIINKELSKNIKPKYVENPVKNYVMHTLADTTKAEKKLGFKAKTSLKEGVKKCVKYYSERLSC